MSLAKILIMQTAHVQAVARLHRLILPTLNARLGCNLLENLYETVLADPWAGAWVAQDAVSGALLGFLTATRDYAKTRKNIHSYLSLSIKIKTAWKILLSPKNLKQQLGHSLLERYFARRLGNPYPTILTLGVHPEAQGQGIAERFIESADIFFRQNRLPCYYVDTESSNARARNFYKGAGFEEITVFCSNAIFRRSLSHPGTLGESSTENK